MKHKKNSGRMNNRGFSLVELLVAITILAIIVVPMLHSFVTAAKTNGKAKTTLRATTVAQDVMEGLKAYNLEELALQINCRNQGFQLVNNGMIRGGTRELIDMGGSFSTATLSNNGAGHASIYSTDGGASYQFLGQDSHIYYFSIEGIELQDDTNQYDALIRLDASAYKSGTALHAKEFNDMPVVSIDAINPMTDGFYIQPKTKDDEYLAKMNPTAYSGYNITKSNFSRQIVIDIEENAVASQKFYAVSANYVYTGKEPPKAPLVMSEPKPNTIFNNSVTKEPLKNIYIFYYPLYDGAGDTFVINNPDAVPVNLYLIKQKNSALASTIGTLEESYDVDVKIYEGVRTDPAQSAVKIRTNLDINQATGAATASNQAVYWYKDIIYPKANFGINALTGSKEQELIYDVSVSVYRAGAAAANFPADRQLITITGSKDN